MARIEEGNEQKGWFRPTQASDLRLRAFVLGIILIPVNCYWIIMMEKVLTGPFPTTISIFANVVFTLAVITLLNTLLKSVSRYLYYSSAEMLLIYSMVSIGSALAGHDLLPNLIGMMAHPWQMATPENKWMETFIPYLPKWLSVTNKDTLKQLYEGGSSLYLYGNWKHWLSPAIWWAGFIVVLVYVMQCINVIVRKQWSERERLTYPIVQLPVAMTEPTGAIWRNRLFWLGFLIAFGIGVLNGLQTYFPNLPTIPVSHIGHNLTSGITGKPWEALGGIPYAFYPFVIGLGYMLPVDLSFSCWFFYWYWKLQMVVASAMGLDTVPDFPYVRHQTFGGYVAILAMLVWTSRGYLKQVWLKIAGKESELDDSGEAISYRSAAVGAVVGFILLCAFMNRIGLSPVLCVIAFLIYFMLATAISRMRAELGPPVHDLHFSGPDYMITSSGGLNSLTRGDMVGLTYFFWFNRAYRAHPMPIGIESMKMADVTKSSQKRFFWAIMIAVLVGVFAAFWADLHLGYNLGFQAKFNFTDGFSGEAINNLDKWWKKPDDMLHPNFGANFAMLGGFLTCIGLGIVRLQGFAFPFHPIGYAISGSWAMGLVWCPIMVAWFLKLVTLHYGGLKLYRTALPFFLGLILGDLVIGGIWSLVGVISYSLGYNIPYYSFWGA